LQITSETVLSQEEVQSKLNTFLKDMNKRTVYKDIFLQLETFTQSFFTSF